MSQQIEIEFKNLLTKEEFDKIQDAFNLNKDCFHFQENHYFDTPFFELKEQSSALRIREKSGQYELTLKQPLEVGLLETTQLLSGEQAEKMMNQAEIIPGIVKETLESISFPIERLEYFGSLKTFRAELQYKGGLLVLDHSLYLEHEDYELEYEVENERDGAILFEELLQLYGIPLRKTENKIKRFYNLKYNMKS